MLKMEEGRPSSMWSVVVWSVRARGSKKAFVTFDFSPLQCTELGVSL